MIALMLLSKHSPFNLEPVALSALIMSTNPEQDRSNENLPQANAELQKQRNSVQSPRRQTCY